MKRADLLAALHRAAPALSNKEMVPAFGNFFFDGKTVQAYDDILAIQTPLESDLEGGLPGRLLMEFLGASRVAEVEFEIKGQDCTVKSAKGGRSRLRLSMMALDDFAFLDQWPKAKPNLEGSEALLTALRQCSVSMGLDPADPSRLGVTLAAGASDVRLYSCNNVVVTCSVAKMKPPKDLEAAILPVRFCEFLLERSDAPDGITVAKDFVEARYSDGTRVWCKGIMGADGAFFEKLLAHIKDWGKGFLPIPKTLGGCLDRALIVVDPEKPFSKVRVAEGRVRFMTQGRQGSAVVHDSAGIEGEHPDVEVHVRPLMLQKALPYSDEFRITESAVAFKGKGFRSMVSVRRD